MSLILIIIAFKSFNNVAYVVKKTPQAISVLLDIQSLTFLFVYSNTTHIVFICTVAIINMQSLLSLLPQYTV